MRGGAAKDQAQERTPEVVAGRRNPDDSDEFCMISRPISWSWRRGGGRGSGSGRAFLSNFAGASRRLDWRQLYCVQDMRREIHAQVSRHCRAPRRAYLAGYGFLSGTTRALFGEEQTGGRTRSTRRRGAQFSEPLTTGSTKA